MCSSPIGKVEQHLLHSLFKKQGFPYHANMINNNLPISTGPEYLSVQQRYMRNPIPINKILRAAIV